MNLFQRERSMAQDKQSWSLIIPRKKHFILATAVACAAVALGAGFIMPKTYQSGLVLKIGRVTYFSTNPRAAKLDVTTSDIETVAAIQDLVRSEPFMAEVIYRLKLKTTPPKLLKKVKVRINMDARPDEQNNQVIIIAKARTPGLAVKLVSTIAEMIIERHAQLYDQAMTVQHEYEARLQKQIDLFEEELDEMKRVLKGLYRDPKVGAPAVLLLQGAIAGKEKDLLDLKRELSQANEMGRTRLKSENTGVIAAPYTPSQPLSPNPLLNAVAGFILGLTAAVAYAAYKETGAGTGA